GRASPQLSAFRYGVFFKIYRKCLKIKDLARWRRSSILAVDYRRNGYEMPYVAPRPLGPLDERTDEDLFRFEQAPTQGTGGVVLRYDPGTLLLIGSCRLLHGRLARTTRTVRPQPSPRVVSARRLQVGQQLRRQTEGFARPHLLRPFAELA